MGARVQVLRVGVKPRKGSSSSSSPGSAARTNCSGPVASQSWAGVAVVRIVVSAAGAVSSCTGKD